MPALSDPRVVPAALPGPRSTALGAYLEGWRRTLAAPHVVIGVFLVAAVTTLPIPLSRGMIPPADFTTEILGFGGALAVTSLAWGRGGLQPELIGTFAGLLVLSIFLSGGAIDRLARARRLGGDVFLSTCGRHFLRLLRFSALAAVGYWVLLGWLYPAIVGRIMPWLAGSEPAEWRLLASRTTGYALFFLLLGFFSLVADISRVRLVVEDRLSALAGWTAGWRFVRRRAGRLAVLFVLNVLGHAVIARLWLQLTPPASAPDWLLFVAAGLHLLARVSATLAFAAAEVVFFQGELAHATYVAAPVPAWPDSASVEALSGLRVDPKTGAGRRLR